MPKHNQVPPLKQSLWQVRLRKWALMVGSILRSMLLFVPRVLHTIHRKTTSKVLALLVGISVLLGIASGMLALLPSLQIEVNGQFEPGYPFPASITIINGIIPIGDVSVFVRICSAMDTGLSGVIVSDQCSALAGGITMASWQDHRWGRNGKWTVLMGRNVPFQFDPLAADISLAVKYWPWLLPRMESWRLFEQTQRLKIHEQPDGQRIWVLWPED